MMPPINYRIGLDIGIASVGWSVILNNALDEPCHIVDMGVRIFEKSEDDQTGATLAMARRGARSQRRLIRRRKHRLDRVKHLLEEKGIIVLEAFEKRYHEAGLPDVYKLRTEALDRKLSNDELAQVLIHIAKHRGFKSNRKADAADKESGLLLAATADNKKLLMEKGYRTVGEMLYKDSAFRLETPWNKAGFTLNARNRDGSYKHTMLRDLLVDEVNTIFDRQQALGNAVAGDDLREAYLAIMTAQRSFDMGPGGESPYALDGFEDKVGICTLEREEKRAAKAAYTAEYFNVLQKINHTRIISEFGDYRGFTAEEKVVLLNEVHIRKSLTYAQVKAKLKLNAIDTFSTLNYNKQNGDLAKTEKTKFISMPFTVSVKEILEGNPRENEADRRLYDEVARILTNYKNDDNRTEALKKLHLADDKIQELLMLTPAQHLHLSVKAMNKLIPFLEQGMVYSDACEHAGYQSTAKTKMHVLKSYKVRRADGSVDIEKTKVIQNEAKEIQKQLQDITSPVVRRAISQSLKVLNAIILKYGSPQAIHVELAREMAKTFDERHKITSSNKKRQDENGKFLEEISKFINNPKGQDLVKYRLWQQQDGFDPYTGRKIPVEQLFKNDGYEIDHILPYSKSMDDSYANKVLVAAEANRLKKNQTPYEYFEHSNKSSMTWDQYVSWVLSTIKDENKRRHMLKKHIHEDEERQFIARNLNDTRYATRFVLSLIRDYLEFAPWNTDGKKKHAFAVNGVITGYLRKRWGLPQKNRETHQHHSVDAVVIACVTDHMIQRISSYSKQLEMDQNRYVDPDTGEILDRAKMDAATWKRKLWMPMPWKTFRDELVIRLGDDPLGFITEHSDVMTSLNLPEWMLSPEVIHPIFVSHMETHKITGKAHDDTIRSGKYLSTIGNAFSKVAIETLKINNNTGEIDGFADKHGELLINAKSDMLLYNALKNELLGAKLEGRKPFYDKNGNLNAFHKPKSDGTEGPIVRKVKIMTKVQSGVELTNNAIAGRKKGAMIRIDVFRIALPKKPDTFKYHFVPIYIDDAVRQVMPMRAAAKDKPQSEWKIMKESDFIFSLYPNDLIYFKSARGVPVASKAGNKFKLNEGYVYYKGADISGLTIKVESHDGLIEDARFGIQTLDAFEKYTVDILGNKSLVKHEKRRVVKTKKQRTRKTENHGL